ncbi:MAG: PEGA domain-containing protein [Verrucomicrobia bacterium]|nr:MAG: PEGA domain-containing protein [Verrucomicrobiota bacterium]
MVTLPPRVRFSFGAVFLTLTILGTGCASVTRGPRTDLKVISIPPGAQVSLSSGQTGITPVMFALSRKKDVVVDITKSGYKPQKVMVTSKFSSAGGVALAGNALIGGLIGVGIDGLTGATLSLYPNPVSVTLIPEGEAVPEGEVVPQGQGVFEGEAVPEPAAP